MTLRRGGWGREHGAAVWLAVAVWLTRVPAAACQRGSQGVPQARPRLVVVITVDQFRADYLDRFRPFFGSGGFNLFLQRGARFPEARYRHTLSALLGLASPGGAQDQVLPGLLR